MVHLEKRVDSSIWNIDLPFFRAKKPRPDSDAVSIFLLVILVPEIFDKRCRGACSC